MLNISMFTSPVPFPLSLHLPFPWLFTALFCIFHSPSLYAPLQLYFLLFPLDICHLSFPLFVGGQWLLGGISHLKRWREGWEQEAWDPDWHSLTFGVALLSSPLLLHSPPHLLCLSTPLPLFQIYLLVLLLFWHLFLFTALLLCTVIPWISSHLFSPLLVSLTCFLLFFLTFLICLFWPFSLPAFLHCLYPPPPCSPLLPSFTSPF